MHGKSPSFGLKGDLIHVYKSPERGCREDGARVQRRWGQAPHWRPVTEQEVMGTNGNTEDPSEHQEIFFTLRVTKHWHRLHREWWSLHPQRYFKAVWTQSWATGSGGPA